MADEIQPEEQNENTIKVLPEKQYEPISVKGEFVRSSSGSWQLLISTEAYALHSYDSEHDGEVSIEIIGYRHLYNEEGKEWRMTGGMWLLPGDDDA